MSLWNLIRSSNAAMSLASPADPISPAGHAELVARYQRLRAASSKLGNRLLGGLPKDVLDEGAAKLGVLHRGKLVFNSEGELAVLMDYCIYHVYRHGRNAVEEYLAEATRHLSDEERLCLLSMQRASYSVFLVESVEPGLGIHVRDLSSGETGLVVDMGLGATGLPGMLLATRILPQEGFSMTSGAALPLGILPPNKEAALRRALIAARTIDEQGRFDPAPLIRVCLEQNNSSHIEYRVADPLSGDVPAPHYANALPKPRPSLKLAARTQNSPCPCGSGKKFKQCCRRKLGRKAK